MALLTELGRGAIQSSSTHSEDLLTAPNKARNLTFFAAALAVLAAAAGLLLSPSSGAADPSFDSEEQQFLTLINNYRSQNGKGALVAQVDLNEAADWYVNDMAAKNYFGTNAYCSQFGKTAHCDSLGRMPPERVKAFGYPQSVGENAAAGFSTAQQVFNAWKGSSGHNSNMLGGSYLSIGIGRACKSGTTYGCYWVTDFGFYTGPGSPPGPSGTAAPTQPPTNPPTNPPTAPPTAQPTPTPPPPTPAPTAAPTPQPTIVNLIWDDFDCDGSVTPSDAIEILTGSAGIDAESTSCPAMWELLVLDGAYRMWGDTDCSLGVQVSDGIKLLAYLAGVPFDVSNDDCPAPGTQF